MEDGARGFRLLLLTGAVELMGPGSDLSHPMPQAVWSLPGALQGL